MIRFFKVGSFDVDERCCLEQMRCQPVVCCSPFPRLSCSVHLFSQYPLPANDRALCKRAAKSFRRPRFPLAPSMPHRRRGNKTACRGELAYFTSRKRSTRLRLRLTRQPPLRGGRRSPNSFYKKLFPRVLYSQYHFFGFLFLF